MRAIDLTTEYLTDPIGIDTEFPHLSWKCSDGIKQTAYKIDSYNEDGEPFWSSGIVQSDLMTHICFPEYVAPNTRIYWTVTVRDENEEWGMPSGRAFFETAIAPDMLKAEWITGNYKVNKKNRYPVDCFKKTFSTDKKIKKARLYASACGIYSISVNGKTVSMPLAPGITDYRKRIQLQTYDITGLLGSSNTVEALLADGWYRGSVGAWGLRNRYGTQTKLLVQIEITHTDGSVLRICSDRTWAWSNDGPITFADNKDGERVDARKQPSYAFFAKETSHPVVPTPSDNVPIAEKEVYTPVSIKKDETKTLIDFGKNLAGIIGFSLTAHDGERITVTLGEMLDNNGELTLKNIQCSTKKRQTPLQRIEYICREGKNEYKTKFAIFGFRYAQITAPEDIDLSSVRAIAVYSDIRETGFFDSSNELLDKFVNAVKQSAKSNSTDLPTDCPTRERHGWTGDAQIFFNTASYLFDYAAFSKKYLCDVYDIQAKNGKLPQIAPNGGVDFYMKAMDGSVGWADAGVLIPYGIYKKYADISILEEYYERMKRYARFMQSRCGKPYPTGRPVLISPGSMRYLCNFGQAYGEWAEPADVAPQSWTTCVVTHPETATAYTYLIMKRMSEIAAVLGKSGDAEEFENFAEGCKRAYGELLKTKDYSLDTDRQARLVRPLFFGLLDGEKKKFAQKRLIKALDNYGWRVGTGFLSTPLILYVLADIDIRYAYRLLENTEMPGWLFMAKEGATTVWESWEGTAAQNGIGSLNHYSKGAVCEWLFSVMCGINISGKNEFTLTPRPGGHFTFAKASYDSVFGKVCSAWEVKNGKTVYCFSVPANCTAKIKLPGGTEKTVSAGQYEFTEEETQ